LSLQISLEQWMMQPPFLCWLQKPQSRMTWESMIQPPISVLTIENSIAQERKALLSLRVLHIIDFQSWHCGFPAPKNLSSGDTSTVSQIKKNVVFLAFLICVMPSGLWNAPNIPASYGTCCRGFSLGIVPRFCKITILDKPFKRTKIKWAINHYFHWNFIIVLFCFLRDVRIVISALWMFVPENTRLAHLLEK